MESEVAESAEGDEVAEGGRGDEEAIDQQRS